MNWEWLAAILLSGLGLLKLKGSTPSAGSTTVQPPPTSGGGTTAPPVNQAPPSSPPVQPNPVPVPVTSTPPAPAPTNVPSVKYQRTMPSGGFLQPGDRVNSINGAHWQLNYQQDGNFVLYGPNGPVWASDTFKAGGSVWMNTGGNLIIYAPDGSVPWTSETDGHPGATLFVGENGAMAIIDADGKTVIKTLTGAVDQTELQSSTIGPSINSLPSPPGRDALCRIKAAFNGDVEMTTELGTYDSWGPEVSLLSAGSRAQTYASHRAWGATHIFILAAGSYNGASGYLNGLAAGNNYFGNLSQLYDLCVECIAAGLTPVVALDGDDGYQQIYNNLPNVVAAMRNGRLGDLTPYICYMSGFDTIDSIGLQQNQDGGATESAMLTFVRNTIGPDAVHVKEMWAYNPAIWQFPPNDAWSGIDVFAFEFQGLRMGNEAAPKIISGKWDAEHQDFAPIYDKEETSWTIPWQVLKRMTPAYQPTNDQPFDVVVPVSSDNTAANMPANWISSGKTLAQWTGPAVTSAPVSSDSRGGAGGYTAAGCPRGKQFICHMEFGTYRATHDAPGSDKQAIQNTRAWLSQMNPDSIC